MNAQSTPLARPQPFLLGYCLKEFPPSPNWLGDPRVHNIASFAVCNLPRPDGWIERWDFNEAGLYDTPEQAEAALANPAERRAFHLFGYEFFPLRFDRYGNAASVDVTAVFGGSFGKGPSGSLVRGFEFLGYDAVERWAEPEPGQTDERAMAGGFGCSPLFCNLCSKGHPINEHCLLTEWMDAVHAARRFAIDQPEPGCYYIFGVWSWEPAQQDQPGSTTARPES